MPAKPATEPTIIALTLSALLFAANPSNQCLVHCSNQFRAPLRVPCCALLLWHYRLSSSKRAESCCCCATSRVHKYLHSVVTLFYCSTFFSLICRRQFWREKDQQQQLLLGEHCVIHQSNHFRQVYERNTELRAMLACCCCTELLSRACMRCSA